jgi:hypothetical protein
MLILAVLLAVAMAKGGGGGGSGSHSVAPVATTGLIGNYSNESYAIHRNPSLLFSVADPYAMHDIFEHWGWTTPQLKFLLCVKLTTALLTFYYLGLLLWTLLFRRAFAHFGHCEFSTAEKGPKDSSGKVHNAMLRIPSTHQLGTKANAESYTKQDYEQNTPTTCTVLKIKLGKEIIAADHRLRGTTAFVGEIQVFSKVHRRGVHDESDGGLACSYGPAGTFFLDGIKSQDAFQQKRKSENDPLMLDRGGTILWSPHYPDKADSFTKVDFTFTDDGLLTLFLINGSPMVQKDGESDCKVYPGDVYSWADFSSYSKYPKGLQWVLKNEGRRSPFSGWLALMPLVILFDETLLFAEVEQLGNGRANPYMGSHTTDDLTILVPFIICLMTWLTFKCVNWATDSTLSFLDVLTYKFNQFGTLTGLQNLVNELRRDEKITATNHYQDLTCSFDKVLLVFATQTLLVGLYCIGMHSSHMPALNQLVLSRWVCGIIMQSLVLAGKSDAGGGFFGEIPYWVCLHQQSEGKSSILYRKDGEQNPRGISSLQIKIRMLFSLIVNSFFRSLIIITLPSSLARCSLPMDFVLNSFAVLFVGTLDDMGGDKDFFLDFDDDYDIMGYGRYARNYVGLLLLDAGSMWGQATFCARLACKFACSQNAAPHQTETEHLPLTATGSSARGQPAVGSLI